MTTWDEIRDEIAGMLADGKPLEDVISKLDQMNKPKQMTNEEYIKSLNTEQLAEFLFDIGEYDWLREIAVTSDKALRITDIAEWLKQQHGGES